MATRDAIRDEWARRRLLAFTKRTFPEYRAGWFHRVVAERLDSFLADIAAKRSPRLILTAPPQHGKSELVSRRLPAFALGRNPDLKVIATSYSADRAFDCSNDVQHIMDTKQYHDIFPETRIVGEYAKAGEARRAVGLFQVVGHRGRYRAAGVGGGITGEPADLLIIDDPIKDFAEAISENVRESVWNWLTSTAMTRLQEGGGVIIMATRWHLDDPIGRLLEKQPGRWELVNFRAIAEEDEPPHRLEGEPLSVERYSLESLVATRDGGATSSYQWEALYQQRPSPLGGGIFKRDDWQRIKTGDLPAKFSEIIQSWDCAFKDTRSSDFVVGQVWGIAGAGRYLLDQVRGHMSFSGTLEAIRQMSAKWPQATRKLVEDKANGTAVIDTLNSEIAGLIPVEPQGGKEARAHAVSAFVEAHNVYLPADAPWVAAFIEGAAQFPNGAHDDQVDGMTQAPNFLRGDGYWFFDLELMGNLWGVAKTAARALLPERSAEHDASDSGVATCATPEGIFKRQADAQMQVSIQADSRIAAVFGQNRKPVAAVKDTVKASSASTPARPQCGAFLSRRETPRGEKVETCNPCGWSNVIPPIVTERFDGTISNS